MSDGTMGEQARQAIFSKDERITYIVEYPWGFVHNSYKYRCKRKAIRTYRDGSSGLIEYDAKRSTGKGPAWVAFSERGGRLVSG